MSVACLAHKHQPLTRLPAKKPDKSSSGRKPLEKTGDFEQSPKLLTLPSPHCCPTNDTQYIFFIALAIHFDLV
jgi:hypothetical protein